MVNAWYSCTNRRLIMFNIWDWWFGRGGRDSK